MTTENTDDTRSTAPNRRPRDVTDPAAISRLEQELESETRTSSSLRESLEALRTKVEQLESGFNERLAEATRRSATAENKLADQQQRLAALGHGREETMRQLAETRAELARVRAERDTLLKKLASIEGMQTSTVALTEQEKAEDPGVATLPSMDDLMASLNGLESRGSTQPAGGHLLARVSLDDEESQEMIAPELVFPEEYGKDEKQDAPASDGPISRVLVFLDAPQPIKYPLYKKVMTIGRSEEADIHVPGDFISRVHARLVTTDSGVVVEDVASKNGIKVNSKSTDRQTLQHGDVLGIGKLRFTFIDTSADPE
jgi:FHA domain-containing protein